MSTARIEGEMIVRTDSVMAKDIVNTVIKNIASEVEVSKAADGSLHITVCFQNVDYDEAKVKNALTELSHSLVALVLNYGTDEDNGWRFVLKNGWIREQARVVTYQDVCDLSNVYDIISGKKRIFNSHGADSDLNERTGSSCEIIRKLTEKEADPEVGSMYHIRFEDGFETDAFEDELK